MGKAVWNRLWTVSLSSLLPLSPDPNVHSWKKDCHCQVQNQTSKLFAGDDDIENVYILICIIAL